MKRQRANQQSKANQKRAMMEKRAHEEVDAITKQLRQIRMEAKYKYIVSKSPGIQINRSQNPPGPSRFARESM